jgi:ATP-dependent exoDNAse (exonuclease V) beta subunit
MMDVTMNDQSDAVGDAPWINPLENLLQEDEANRRRALDLSSFIVEAPAGAGKTELLTQRFLRLLATVDEPEEIIAITFTRKAAGEMRQRIQDSLNAAHSGKLPDAAHKRITFGLACEALARSAERGWQLTTMPGRLRLTTIDALCASLARQMPLLSRFGAQPGVAEDARPYYLDAARRALDHLEDEDAHAEDVATALGYLDNDVTRLVNLLAEMLARREQWREIAELARPEVAIDTAINALVDEALLTIAGALDDAWQMRLMPLARFAAAQLGAGAQNQAADGVDEHALLDWTSPLAPERAKLPAWRALAALLLTKEGSPRKTVTVKNGFPSAKEFKAQKEAMLAFLAALDAEQIAALRRIGDLPRAEHAQDAVIKALVGLMKLAAAELWLVFRERGEVDFSELSTRAIAALGEEDAPSELGLRLDYRVRHLLVDEFQDTSPLQIELLQRLTAGWQAGDGRTLFAVGDPMQSIYRFRRADVGLFLRVAQQGIGNIKLDALRLSRNNRSCPAVVDWINAHFPSVFPGHDDPLRGEISYRPFVATREGLPDAGVCVHLLAGQPAATQAQVAKDEARKIIALIKDEWQQDPKRDIAVLVRARNHLTALVTALRQETDWRFSAVDIEPLVGRQSVQDLIALTRAMHHRGDRLNWLAILRAPWCGLTLADLFALAGDDHTATVWSLMNDALRVARLSEAGQARVQFMRAILQDALAGQGRQRRRVWVEDVWRQLGGPQCLAAHLRQDAQAFFDRLDKLDAAGRFTPDSLETDMAALYAAADAEADGRLQLMTVHKSKGLEFDTVILPALHKKPSGRDTPLLAWDSFALSMGERLIAAPVNVRRADKTEPTVYDFLQKLEKERSSNEEARVLYVAATRAVRRLHLIGGVWVKKAEGERALSGALDMGGLDMGGFDTPSNDSSLGLLWPTISAVKSAADVDIIAMDQAVGESEAGDLVTFVPQLVRQKHLPAIVKKMDGELDGDMDDERRRGIANTLADAQADKQLPASGEAADPFAAALGTLTHALLEQMSHDIDAWHAARLNAVQPAAERWLASRGWPLADAITGAAKVMAMLHTTLASEAGRWVLTQHEGAAAEWVLSSVPDSSKVGAGDTPHSKSPWGAPHSKSPGGMANSVETRVVDRTFIDKGVRWIIDYKTADLGETATDAQFAAHAARFQPQLARYGRLFANEALPQQLAIFYVAHGRLVLLK